MDDKYLKKYNMMLEYLSMGDNTISEDDTEAPAPDMGGDPNAAPVPDMGGAPAPDMNGDPNAAPAPDMGGDPNAAPAPDMGGDPNAAPDAGQGVEGFEPQGEEQPDLGTEGVEEEDEEVIDVDELTDSQEKTERKVEKMASKFEKLFDVLNNFEKNLDANSQSIENLSRELEKRNPTPVEKLSLRSGDGYPFNISVDDYWKDKGITSDNYSAEDDNDGQDDEIYTITKNDIDAETNWPSISKSLDDSDLHMSLKDILGY